ncbi:hypothetical protein ACJMK2_038416 [Sinanodonta woodiana]|uniref:Nucleoporin NUP188 n=1 Tax=Sinanodonta woodiana TaxID=1069815 RepID=A0ABD3W8Y4_SINWO
MAGPNQTPKMESFGNRNLWHFISGTGILRPKELISRELHNNKEKLLNGLLFYNRPNAPQGEQLKDKNISAIQKEFIQRLSIFLGLEEAKSFDLFCSYISQDFHGSQRNLKLSLSTERHSQGLLFKIRDFYYTERLYLLQCLKQLLGHWQDVQHEYRIEYCEFLNTLLDDNKLIEKIIHQIKALCDAELPGWENYGPLMKDRQVLIWAHQNLKEQQELLEILNIYWKDFEVHVDKFVDLLERFKRQGFGRRQVYRHILDESADRILKRIGCLEVVVLLQALDMENLQTCGLENDFSEHTLLKDKEAFQKVDKLMHLFGSEVPHGPILLSWAVARQMFLDGDDFAVTRQMGNLALQLNVFEFLSELLDREPFSGTSITALLSHFVVYAVMRVALSVFDEKTLGRNDREVQLIYDVSMKLLKRSSIADDVWNRGLDDGVGNLLKSAVLSFPLKFGSLVQLSTAMASANANSTAKVLELWSELHYYTEYLDRNSAQDLISTRDSTVWKLARDKIPYEAGDFRISAGVEGQIVSAVRRGMSDLESPVIRWAVTYDGWQLLKCEIEELLHQISKGAGMVSQALVGRVTLISEFIYAILVSNPAAMDGLQDLTCVLYQVIQRFTTFNPPPLDLIAACVCCVTCVAKCQTLKAWHNMKQTGLLPFLTENVDSLAEVLSGQGLSPGLFGALLAGFETQQGRYQLTVAFLDLILELVQPLFKHKLESELMPSIMYILREIFPVHQKWRYYNTVRKEKIGQLCLDIFHKILNFVGVKGRYKSTRPHLQEVVMYSLLFSEAGRTLLEIAATGTETVEILLAQQSSDSEGAGEDMVQLIQIAFSVLNRLLILRPEDLPLSPVESALSSQPAGWQNQYIVAVIAEYIYHRNNPRLPTLSTLFLKRIACVLPKKILACFGGQADSIRDIYLMRLQSTTEDLRLKTAILEFLSVCVDTQPGLIEVFLNIQLEQTLADKDKKDLGVGKTSCLQTILDLMNTKKQETYQCPADLLCACTEFIQALWAGLRETAMSVLRSREDFWSSLCSPLMRDLPRVGEENEEQSKMLSHRIKNVAFIFKILAQEIYTVTSSKLDANLKKVMQELATRNRLLYWSEYICDFVKAESERFEVLEVEVSGSPSLRLLLAWKDFLVVLGKFNVPELQIGDGLKEHIITDLLEGVHAQFIGQPSSLGHKLAQNCSALFFTLVKSWTSSITDYPQIIMLAHRVVVDSLTAGDKIVPSIQIGLIGALATILQHVRQNSVPSLQIQNSVTVLATACEALLQSTRELPSPQTLQKRRQETNEKPANLVTHSHPGLKLQTVACCLVGELIQHLVNPEIWLPLLQEHAILRALLTSAEMYIKAQEAVHYMQTLFLFFLTVAKSERGAEALALSGLTQHTCLVITHCYLNGEPFPPVVATKGKSSTVESVTWHGIYCLCLEVYATMLQKLKYSFVEDALTFVGSHQDRLQQSMDLARLGLYDEAFHEAEQTCSFLIQMSHFSREWRLHLPDVLGKILNNMILMMQTFVSYLIRPRYLLHILEVHVSDRSQSKYGQLPYLQTQTSMDDVDQPSEKLLQVQKSMMMILCRCLATLRQFSPDLCQILLDQNMDINEYEPFLAVGFSTPTVHNDSAPTFGTLLSCISVCMRMLSKSDTRVISPQRHLDHTTRQAVSRHVVMFVLENSLYIALSQAMLYLKNPNMSPRDKQLLKRELSTEFSSFLSGIHRFFKRGGPSSPGNISRQPSPRSQSPGNASLSRSISQTFSSNQDQVVFRLVQEISRQVLR